MNYKLIYIIIGVIFIYAGSINAQVPSPVPSQNKPIILMGGTAHLGNGEVIENSAIAFENGKITTVSKADNLNLDFTAYEVINVEGKHVYPGLILANTSLGLVEIGGVRATIDSRETGTLNPNVRSIIAYNTDSEVIPTLRSNGILLAQITPQGGVVSGSSTIVQLDAWNWEDAAYKTDDAIHLNWPGMFQRSGREASSGTTKNPNYDKTVALLDKLFTDAVAYNKLKDPKTTNMKLVAMKGLFDGSQKLFIRAGYVKEIVESIKFAKKHGVKGIVLVGGDEDAWRVKDFLKENNIPVIVANLHRLPKRKDEDVKMPFKLPYLFYKEGILTGLDYPRTTSSMNLPFYAGTAAAYGLTKEEALMTITSNMAKILGINDKVGTIEKDKDANIIVSTGDLLDIRTSNVEYAFINGRKIDLDNKHKRLYRKFKEKYDKQGK